MGVEHGTAPERWILGASILGSSMAFIDGTVVNVALPVLQTSLNATGREVLWVVESYALVLASLLLLGGALADQIGRRLVFGLGVGVFAFASAGCALASNIHWLIGARSLQGVGAALLVPSSLALLSAGFPAGRRGKAIGTWSAFSAGTAGVGPLLGGWLVQIASWRSVFWINIPIAVATLVMLWRWVPESRDQSARGRLDFLGATLATLGLGGLVFGMLEGPRLGFGHPAIVIGLLGGGFTLAAFTWVEQRSPQPMVPLRLFRLPTFAGANLLTFLLYSAMGTLFFLPFNLVQVHGYTPLEAGASMMPMIGLISVLSRSSGRVADHYGVRVPLIFGPLVVGSGYLLLALPGAAGSYWSTFFPGMAVIGLGMAISVAPLTTAVMTSAGQERAGVASGINNAVSRAGSLLSIAVAGVLAYQRFGSSLVRRLDTLGVPSTVRDFLAGERSKLAGASIPSSLPEPIRQAVKQVIDLAFVDAFKAIMVFAAALSAGAAAAAWLLIAPLRSGKRSGPRRRSRASI